MAQLGTFLIKYVDFPYIKYQKSVKIFEFIDIVSFSRKNTLNGCNSLKIDSIAQMEKQCGGGLYEFHEICVIIVGRGNE